jgi:hypothetical protein
MPIPFGLTGDQFATRFRGLLEKHSQTLIAELRSILVMPIGEGVTGACVEIFLDENGQAGPSFGLYFDGKNKRVDHTDRSIFPGRHLSLAEYVHELPTFDHRYFVERDFKALDIEANIAKA